MEAIEQKIPSNKFLLKYAFDKLLAIVMLIVSGPLIIVLCLAIWLERFLNREAKGPILYRETRISQGEPFVMLKFRTLKLSVLQNITESDSATFLQVDRKNVTHVGKIIIQMYLDEMPQFINILLGHMTFVGPRPRIPRVYQDDLKENHVALKYLRGGITGLHQISKGTKVFDIEQSEEYYQRCRESSAVGLLIYDFGILGKTVLKMTKAEGL